MLGEQAIPLLCFFFFQKTNFLLSLVSCVSVPSPSVTSGLRNSYALLF
jgi:hypothetical protein